jgi:hypothetical protein
LEGSQVLPAGSSRRRAASPKGVLPSDY